MRALSSLVATVVVGAVVGIPALALALAALLGLLGALAFVVGIFGFAAYIVLGMILAIFGVGWLS